MKIFLSYRRTDTLGFATLFNAEFKRSLPDAEVFIDVDNLGGGTIWKDEIMRSVAACDVMLVVIGDEWLIRRDKVKPIDDPDDGVRFEIAQSLQRRRDQIRIVPVCVEGAGMPTRKDLPPDVQGLCDHQAQHIHNDTVQRDLTRLVDLLRAIDAQGPQAAIADQHDAVTPAAQEATAASSHSSPGLPSRISDSWLKDNVPRMDVDTLTELVLLLKDRRWSDEDIQKQVVARSPHAPPKKLPSRMSIAWLERNVPLLSVKRTRELVVELQRRRWTDEDIRQHVLSHHPDAFVKEIPSRVTTRWLEINAVLMSAEQQTKLAETLRQRGWYEDEISYYLPDAAN